MINHYIKKKKSKMMSIILFQIIISKFFVLEQDKTIMISTL